jgi:hypothetical protein
MIYTAKFEDGILLGFDNNDAPFLSQPTWPDGTAWASEAEALAWFDVLVTSFTDASAPIVGDNPTNHPKERVVTQSPELAE